MMLFTAAKDKNSQNNAEEASPLVEIDEGDDNDYYNGDEENNDDDDDDDHYDIFDHEFDGHVVRDLVWDDNYFITVIFRLHDSILPQVWVLCIFNVILVWIIWNLKRSANHGGWQTTIDLTANPSAHEYLAILLSFALSARVARAMDSYVTKARLFSSTFKACRDLVDHMCLWSAQEKTTGAKQWRQDVAFSVLQYLRVLVALMEYKTKTNPWLLPHMIEEVDELWMVDYTVPPPPPPVKPPPPPAGGSSSTYISGGSTTITSNSPPHSNRFVMGNKHNTPRIMSPGGTTKRRPKLDEVEKRMGGALRDSLSHIPAHMRNTTDDMFRAPLLLAWKVRLEILKWRDDCWFQVDPWDRGSGEEFGLLQFMDEVMKSYAKLYALISTPTPFPIYQLVNTTLFVWIFTLPMVLCHETWVSFTGNSPIIPAMVCALITYGFGGLFFVARMLADPFGDHPSSLDYVGHTQLCMEDCYMTICRQDGKRWAKALKERCYHKQKQA